MARPKSFLPGIMAALGSIELAVINILLLFYLVYACTMEQPEIGMFRSVDKYFRSAFLYANIPGIGMRVPVFPAGGAAGLVLLANVLLSMVNRLQRTWKKSGIWLIHIGLILLVTGEFVTGIFAIETRMSIEEGQTVDYTESARDFELAVIASAETEDTVFAVRGDSMRTGRDYRDERWPFRVHIKRFFPNAAIGDRPVVSGLPPSVADKGLGRTSVVQPLEEVTDDEHKDTPAAFIEVFSDEGLIGTWLVSTRLDHRQTFEFQGREFGFILRSTRRYLPFSLTLKDFTHDVYPGTGIPRNFSSLVRLRHRERKEDREALIYMNNPLRYLGRTFYQSSFGKNDTLSVFQVVENPGWLLPYLSFVLMAIGLCVHFLISLARFKPQVSV